METDWVNGEEVDGGNHGELLNVLGLVEGNDKDLGF